VRKVLKEKADSAVSGCYTVVYSGKEGGTGSLVVDFVVNPNGNVASVGVTDSTLGDPTFEDCVRKVYERLTFPKAPGATEAARPYNFKNSQGELQDTAAASE
jgi:TonB family protein